MVSVSALALASTLVSAVNITIIVHIFVFEYFFNDETIGLIFDRVFTNNQSQQHQIVHLMKFG